MAITDIALGPDGDLTNPARLMVGQDLVAQRIGLRLGLHEGDVLRSTSIGLPWGDWLSTKPPPISRIRARVRREVAAVPGVVSVSSVTVEQDGATLGIEVDCSTAEGEMTVTATVEDSTGETMSFMANFWGRGSSVIL